MATRKRTTRAQPAEPQNDIAEAENAAADPATPAAAPVERVADGRRACSLVGCHRPELVDGAGLCGAHWALRPDLRRKAGTHE